MTSNRIGEWEIFVAGTASWGDSPPDPWQQICTLKYAAGKVWDALGYTWPSDCVPPKEDERGIANKTSFQLHYRITALRGLDNVQETENSSTEVEYQ